MRIHNYNVFFFFCFILFLFEEIFYFYFSISVQFKIVLLVYLFVIRLYFKNCKISLLYSTVLAIGLIPFSISTDMILIEKTMFRYIVLIVSFVCIETICSKIIVDQFSRFLCVFSSTLTLINLLLFPFNNSVGRYGGVNVNSIS